MNPEDFDLAAEFFFWVGIALEIVIALVLIPALYPSPGVCP